MAHGDNLDRWIASRKSQRAKAEQGAAAAKRAAEIAKAVRKNK